MCGIAGYSLQKGDGSLSSSLLNAKTALAHRGPDDSGVFEDLVKGIGLVHTRLSILDLSPQGHQPMASPDGKVMLVFNGEIYNFKQLRDELTLAGHAFKGNSDTEVLLHLYLANRDSGESFTHTLRSLNGIFSFALWDGSCNVLLLARDAFGVKPLYYSNKDGRFAFASELKALQALMPTSGLFDAAAINRYMTFLWCPGNDLPAQDVKTLAPGEFMKVQNGVICERKIWYTLPTFRGPARRLSLTEAVTGTEQHLRQAVERQLVADVPVGAFLSGGLDSSAVVAFARETSSDIRCFTIESVGGAEKGTADDLPYARRVADHLRVPLEVVRIDAVRMAQDLQDMVAQLDEPLADPAPLNVLYISRLAREHGIKVLLSGAGGDDLFTGYRRHQAILAERYWKWLPKSFLHCLENITANLDQRKPLGRRLRKVFDGAALDGDARLVNYFSWNRRQDLLGLYTPEFRRSLGDADPAAPMLEFLAALPSTVSPIERMLALEQRFFLADHNLIYTDKMSMVAGVEVRVPFLDLDLVEFAASIPSRFKQHGSEGKWVLKQALEPYLPRDVIYRPKTGFGAPLRRWMRYELRELLNDVLSEASLRRRGLFDPIAVHQLIRDNDEGRIDASYTLLSLLCMELWFRRFMDQTSVS